ncbi:MAG TPA: DivIVA domain-containing protein [Candidatus Limnocylindrales bacterium]|nr:DivIVA domain-containing protein [Candidatus Limnocylindrales bacterium]
MPLSPLEVQKMRFPVRMRGYDPREVEQFLELVAEELTGRLGDFERLQREVRYYQQRLEEGERREHQLQETLVRAQKVADEITEAAEREARVVVREAEITADHIVQQAMEQATRIEGKVDTLRLERRELLLRFKNTLELLSRVVESETRDEEETAIVRTLPRKKREA